MICSLFAAFVFYLQRTFFVCGFHQFYWQHVFFVCSVSFLFAAILFLFAAFLFCLQRFFFVCSVSFLLFSVSLVGHRKFKEGLKGQKRFGTPPGWWGTVWCLSTNLNFKF